MVRQRRDEGSAPSPQCVDVQQTTGIVHDSDFELVVESAVTGAVKEGGLGWTIVCADGPARSTRLPFVEVDRQLVECDAKRCLGSKGQALG